MSQYFGTPNGHLCVHSEKFASSYMDVAFLPITSRVSVQECRDYLKKNYCEIMDMQSVMDLLNMIHNHVPASVTVVGPKCVLSFARRYAVELTSGFLEAGDLLLCARDAMYGMSDLFPKGPFVKPVRMIDATDLFGI